MHNKFLIGSNKVDEILYSVNNGVKVISLKIEGWIVFLSLVVSKGKNKHRDSPKRCSMFAYLYTDCAVDTLFQCGIHGRQNVSFANNSKVFNRSSTA